VVVHLSNHLLQRQKLQNHLRMQQVFGIIPALKVVQAEQEQQAVVQDVEVL